MSNLFAAQEVTRKQDHKDFKEDIKEIIKEGIRTKVEAIKYSQDILVKDQANLVKKVEDLINKVEDLEKEKKFPVLERSHVPMHINARNHETNNRSESVTLNKEEEIVRKLFKQSNLTLRVSPIS